jgi:hypothetical protein
MRRWIGVLVALVLLTGTAACGSKKVPAQTWAKDICGTIRPWAQGIQSSVTNTKSAVAKGTAPAASKVQLQKVFGDAVTATDKAVKGVDKAGVPDVKNGEQVAKQFRGALVAARDAFAKAEKAVKLADTKDKAAFDTDIGRIGTQLGKDYEAAGKKINVTKSDELGKVFAKTPQCSG